MQKMPRAHLRHPVSQQNHISHLAGRIHTTTHGNADIRLQRKGQQVIGSQFWARGLNRMVCCWVLAECHNAIAAKHRLLLSRPGAGLSSLLPAHRLASPACHRQACQPASCLRTCASAAASFTPSPTMATRRPAACSCCTSAALPAGFTPAYTCRRATMDAVRLSGSEVAS